MRTKTLLLVVLPLLVACGAEEEPDEALGQQASAVQGGRLDSSRAHNFAVGIARPEWGLFALVFALFTNLFGVLAEHHELPGATVNLLVLALGLSVLFRWALRDMPPVDVRRPLMVLIAYGVLGSASLLYARHTGPVAVEVDLYVKSVALGVVAVLLMDGIRSLRVVAWALLSGAILVGTIGVYKYCMGAFDDTFAGFGRALYAHISKGARGWRLSGPMGDPNYFGALLVFVVPLAVERLLHERDKPMRLCAGWALFVSLLCIYFTASRGALVDEPALARATALDL